MRRAKRDWFLRSFRLRRFLAKIPVLRRVVEWYNNSIGLYRYAEYYRDEVDRLRAGRDRDAVKIRDLQAENLRLKRGWRKAQ